MSATMFLGYELSLKFFRNLWWVNGIPPYSNWLFFLTWDIFNVDSFDSRSNYIPLLSLMEWMWECVCWYLVVLVSITFVLTSYIKKKLEYELHNYTLHKFQTFYQRILIFVYIIILQFAFGMCSLGTYL